MSRGLDYEESLAMMIEGYFHKNFASLKEYHKDIFSELLQKFFSLRD
jgi:Fe-S cluster assembly scaffold protein SufB